MIQIPCFNEAQTLPQTIADLPKSLKGVDYLEYLVIDDGSSDDTARVAMECGVHHVVIHPQNKGLAHAFKTGLDACLRRGADIIVNTDADNQYDASCIQDLIQPILDREAEIVVGDRQTGDIKHFSFLKRQLQFAGSWVVRLASRTKVPDAPSGFRAMHKDAAYQMNVFNDFTYTLETIIQAGQKNMVIVSVPVKTNGPTRPSRLFKNIPSYIWRSMNTIVRIFVVYRPMRAFAFVGACVLLPGVLLGMRYLYLMMIGSGDGNIQSLILAAIMIITACLIFISGVLADLIAINRKLLENINTRLQRFEHTYENDKSALFVPQKFPEPLKYNARRKGNE